MAIGADKIEEPPGARSLRTPTPSESYEQWRLRQQSLDDWDPIDLRIMMLSVIAQDTSLSIQVRDTARAYLQRLKQRNDLGERWALLCAIGAGTASAAYFEMMLGDMWDAMEGVLVLSVCAGIAVALASWYMYRHDTTESCIDYEYEERKEIGARLFFSMIVVLTAFVVTMELALLGYGIYECVDDLEEPELQISLVVLLCAFSAVAEASQTYKYNKKLENFRSEFNFEALRKAAKEKPDEYVYASFSFYIASSIVMLTFSGMAIFPLLAELMPLAIAIPTVALYVILGMPYLWKKAEEHVCAKKEAGKDEDASTSDAHSGKQVFFLARFFNAFGDIAFSFFGFYETMKGMGVVEKPHDIFNDLSSSSLEGALEAHAVLLLGILVGVATIASSWIMTAGGDKPGYGKKIEEMQRQDKGTQAPMLMSPDWAVLGKPVKAPSMLPKLGCS